MENKYKSKLMEGVVLSIVKPLVIKLMVQITEVVFCSVFTFCLNINLLFFNIDFYSLKSTIYRGPQKRSNKPI